MSQPAVPTTIYQARSILTMNPARPRATHVAVRDGRILGVGGLDELKTWGRPSWTGATPTGADARPGGRPLPSARGRHVEVRVRGLLRSSWSGWRDLDRAQELRGGGGAAARSRGRAAADRTLIGWGFDPIYFGGERMDRRHLDAVSSERPVVVMHASMHLMNVNGAMLARAGIDADTDVDGITRLPDGSPSGELCEFAAMFPVIRLIGNPFRTVGLSEDGLRLFGQVARRAGVTTATDLVNELEGEGLARLSRITAEPDYPVRIVPAASALAFPGDPARCLETLRAATALNHDKLRLGMVKLVVDGSIQGFTARLRWPGYHNGAPNGIWVTAPGELDGLVQAYHEAGALHIHTNGDEATQVAIEAVARALARHPRPDHRHTLQHCQMADAAQFRRMASLGLCANLFANHIYYWGDAHYAQTMGPDRAERMDACATAAREGVRYAIHSDAPITPLGPLFTAWCAATRDILGPGAGRVRAHRGGRGAARHHAGRGLYAAHGSSGRLHRGRQACGLLRAGGRSLGLAGRAAEGRAGVGHRRRRTADGLGRLRWTAQRADASR